MGVDGVRGRAATVLLGQPDDGARTPQLRSGVVTQVSPLLVRVGSATTAQPCAALGSYSPAVGDAVQVLVLEGDRIVLGCATQRRPATQVGTPASGTTSGTSRLTFNSLTFPAQGADGRLNIDVSFSYESGTSGDQWNGIIEVDGSDAFATWFVVPAALLGGESFSVSIPYTAGTAPVIRARVSRFFGAGSIAVGATRSSSMTVTYVPN